MHHKFLLPLTALFLAFLPDEGQWLPTQVREMDWAKLRARGMELTKDEFWHPDKGGVLSATIHLGGCTASFCSPDGLVITNHHCGFGAISALSTVENNFLRDGFVADERSEELPAPGVTVRVLKKIENVTEQFHEAQAKAETDLERWSITQALRGKLIAEAQESEPNTQCSISEFLEGQEYHLYYRTVLTDVRLVYAPPRAIGEFGGEVDNWEWPRHTGDFSIFRAYAAPADQQGGDPTPRPYHEDNVPFRPKHWLKVSANGVQEGDLAIIMGYPGRTQRYRSSLAVREQQGFVYPKREYLLTEVLAVLEELSQESEERALRLATTIKSLANVQKNARGMVWGLARNAVVERKLMEEAQFTRWVNADSERQAKYGNALSDMLALDQEEIVTQQKDLVLGFGVGSLGGMAPLLAGLVDGCGAAQFSEDGSVPVGVLRRLGGNRMTSGMEAQQKPVLRLLLDEIRILPEGQRLTGSEVLGDGDEEIDAVLDRVLEQTGMLDAEARVALFRGGLETLQKSEDPLVVLALGIAEERRSSGERSRARNGRRLLVGQRWIEAQQAWRGKTFYPDANSSLRVSIAEVKPYVPRDGVVYTPHTTVAGILVKETGEEPFASPSRLLEAANGREDSRFFDQRIGDVPVCFLTNGDTTGGNSGSPVINGKGELVGLNFDRVFENVAGDFGWNPKRSRNISVDIRFVLWVLESVYPAPALLKEMGL